MFASLAIAVLRWSVIVCLFAFVLLFSAKADDSPDAEVRDFALPKLEARRRIVDRRFPLTCRIEIECRHAARFRGRQRYTSSFTS